MTNQELEEAIRTYAREREVLEPDELISTWMIVFHAIHPDRPSHSTYGTLYLHDAMPLHISLGLLMQSAINIIKDDFD